MKHYTTRIIRDIDEEFLHTMLVITYNYDRCKKNLTVYNSV